MKSTPGANGPETTPSEDGSEPAARWAEISQLFAGACELPPEEWSTFLSTAGCADETTRQEVLRLLEAHSQEVCAIDLSPLGGTAARGAAPLEAQSHLVSAAGSYRILERIDEGGVGIVYRAHRLLGGTRQTVALKVIKPGMDTRQALRRFERERQLLASLEHPNIAHLIDLGATPEGRPFLVMEHVDGEPIDRYCDRYRLDLPTRLTLFQDICAAVQHAHQRLVVHSDLKPANVLVTEDGRIKLLDFGLARLLGPEEPTDRTATSSRWLTPNYASPEQARGEAVTGATDVYGLGALLYRLLTGISPHRFRDGSPTDLLQVVCDEVPLPPSQVLSEPPAGAASAASGSAARARSSRPARLRRLLAGDLDTIILKALAKDPAERYPSVADLAADLRRHAEGLPIQARPPTLGYRLHRFLRRHWQLVTAASLILTILISSLWVLSQQVQVASRERLRAEAEKAKAEDVGRLFVEIFEQADPNRERGEELTVREVMDRGLSGLGEEIGERPELKASLFLTAGRVYLKRGVYDRAQALANEALAELRALGDSSSAEFADGLEILGQVHLELGDRARARHFFRHAYSLRQRRFGPHSVEAAKTLGILGDLYWMEGDYQRARSVAREQVAILRQVLGPDHPETAYSQAQLGAYEGFLGDYPKAVELLQSALRTMQAGYGESHLEVARVCQGLGLFLTKMGRYEEARHYYERTLATNEKLLGPEHGSVGVAAASLAGLNSAQGRFAEAEPLYLRALAIFQKIHGLRDHRIAVIHHDVGLVRYRRGDPDLGAAWFGKALELYREVGSGEHPHAAQTGHYLAAIARRQGRLEDAEVILAWVLRIRREKLDPDHPHLLLSLEELGRLRLAQGRLEDAEELFRQVLEARKRTQSLEPLPLAESYYDLATLLAAKGQPEEALEQASRALTIRRGHLDPDHPELAASAHLVEELQIRARPSAP